MTMCLRPLAHIELRNASMARHLSRIYYAEQQTRARVWYYRADAAI